MLFWNKVEIYSGYSPEEFTRLRSILNAANIHYEYKLVDRNEANHGNIMKPDSKSSSKKPASATRYYLYVHQKDYYQAMHLISNRNV